MPDNSAAQQKAAGTHLSVMRGDAPKSKLKGASERMAGPSRADRRLETGGGWVSMPAIGRFD